MKNTICNAAEIWKQFEDLLVPRLGLSVIDRAAYSHLLRHSRLEGKVQLQFSASWLARGIGVSAGPTRNAVHRLVNHGFLRLVQRNTRGHVAEVRLPEEICGLRAQELGDCLPATAGNPAPLNSDRARHNTSPNIEETDFLHTKELRQSIHARERSLCFYCLRRLTSAMQCLDHVVPSAQSGRGFYRNLVSCCLDCNSQKGQTPAGDFLRWLYREGRLTPVELSARLRALQDLASGKLLPPLECPAAHVEAGFSPSSLPLESHANSGNRGTSIVTLCRGHDIEDSGQQPEHRAPPIPPSPSAAPLPTTALAEIERTTILRVFEQTNGDKTLSQKILGISRATLYRKLKRYSIRMRGRVDAVAPEPQ